MVGWCEVGFEFWRCGQLEGGLLDGKGLVIVWTRLWQRR